MSEDSYIKYNVKEKLDNLDCKIDKVNDKVDNIRDNHIYHLNIDISLIKGQLMYIKWFVLLVLGFVVTTSLKMWLL